MKQYIKFTGVLIIDDEPLNWEIAETRARAALIYGDKHQDYTLTLSKVTEIGIDEEE